MIWSGRRLLPIAATLAALASHATGSPVLAEQDRALFERVPTENKDFTKRSERAAILGEQENLAALEYLVTAKKFGLVQIFAAGFRRSAAPTPAANTALQKWLAGMFTPQDSIAEALAAVRTIDDPALFELLFSDVAQLAKWRADRRKRCVGQELGIDSKLVYAPAKPGDRERRASTSFRQQQLLPGNQFLQWRYVCAGSDEDPANTDFDAKPLVRMAMTTNESAEGPWRSPRERRDLASLTAIARTTIPGVEARLAPLLRDLSLMPAFRWKKPDEHTDDLPQSRPVAPIRLLLFLKGRKSAPPNRDLLEILAAYERGMPSAWARSKDEVGALLDLLALHESREGNEALARWIVHLAALEDHSQHAYYFSIWIPRLGQASPENQFDLAQFRRATFELLPYGEIQEVSRLFEDVEKRWALARGDKPPPRTRGSSALPP